MKVVTQFLGFFLGDLEANRNFSLLFAALTDVQIHAHRASARWSANLRGAAALSLMRNDRTLSSKRAEAEHKHKGI